MSDPETNPPVEEQTSKINKTSTITIMGPSKSGKTMMVSTLLNSAKLVEDVIAQDPELNRLSLVRCKDNDPGSLAIIDKAYDDVLNGNGIASTLEAIDIQFDMIVRPESTASGLKSVLAGFSSSSGEDSGLPSTRFTLRDGPGGALRKVDGFKDVAEINTEEHKYLDAMHQSSGLVVCLPANRDDYIDKNFNPQELKLQRLLADGSPLKYIAVCLTKYDMLFPDMGGKGFEFATDMDTALPRIQRIANGHYADMISVLKDLDGAPKRYSQTGEQIQVRVFPVSTFGFIKGNGAANYYSPTLTAPPDPDAPVDKKDGLMSKPGLMTRVISEKYLEATPEMRNHYPAPISDATAREMWHPFNLVAPFYYAATGRLATKYHFDLSDLS